MEARRKVRLTVATGATEAVIAARGGSMLADPGIVKLYSSYASSSCHVLQRHDIFTRRLHTSMKC